MPSLPSSTAFRFAAFFSIAFTLLTLALGVGIYWAIRSELRYDLDQRIVAERSAVLRQAAVSGLAPAIRGRNARDHGDMRYALLDKAGRLVAGQPVVAPPPPGWSAMDFVRPKEEPDATRAFAQRTPDGGLLIVGADPEAIEELDTHMIRLFVAAFGLIVAIGVGGAFVLGRALGRRLDVIDRTANAIIAGDLSRRMPLTGSGDEFDRLSATLNRMLERISNLLGNLRQVSGDIAHDLRTPLTRLRQKLELAVASCDDEATLRGTMQEAIEQTDEMLELFGAILVISEVEAGTGLRRDRLDLSAFVTDLADSYQPSIEDTGRTFAREIEPGVEVEANRELLAQLLVNLLDNALRHTPAGTALAISLAADNGEAELGIVDRGPGIPPEERTRVFDRFMRLERSRSTPGHGLGLSLVAAIAKAHGGDVRIEDNRPGVKMLVRLPRAAQ